MPKKTIKKLMPDHQKIKSNKHLQIFGDLLHNGNLWHLNRRSVAKAFAVGLFFAFVPVPFQMVLAALILKKCKTDNTRRDVPLLQRGFFPSYTLSGFCKRKPTDSNY